MELRAVGGLPLFKLRVARYQFPGSALVGNDPWDINWLEIMYHFETADFTWDSSDPCLTTWEARMLADWLVRVSRQSAATSSTVDYYENAGDDTMTFTEPNLGFSVVDYPTDALAAVRVHVSFVSLDPADLGAPQYELYGSHVDITMSSEALLEAAADLRRELVGYPVR